MKEENRPLGESCFASGKNAKSGGNCHPTTGIWLPFTPRPHCRLNAG